MGLSVDPYAIIGLRIQRSAIYETKIVKAFDHCMPADWTVDPKSGKPLWTKQTCVKPPFVEDDGILLDDFKVIDLTYEKDELYCYIAVLAVEGPDGCERGGASRVPLPDTITTLVEKLRRLTTKLGLWKDSEFGLWATSRVSY